MYCRKCGAEMPEDSLFCPTCGTNILDNNPTNIKSKDKNRNKTLRRIVIICGIVLIILAVVFFVNLIIKSNFQKKIMGTWRRYGPFDEVQYTLVLDISKDEIEYKFESSSHNSTMHTYKYKIVSPDTIEVIGEDSTQSKRITIEFDDSYDWAVMIMTPSITNIDESDIWFERSK